MSGRLRASRTGAKGETPKPLHLGSGDAVHLEAHIDGERAILTVGAPLTKRGAAHLAEWLYAWARPQTRLKLWSPRDIAREMEVSTSTVEKWRARKDFPHPAQTAAGPIWEARAVRVWCATRPRPGRPRKRR